MKMMNCHVENELRVTNACDVMAINDCQTERRVIQRTTASWVSLLSV